ncbi:Calsequestrin-2 [Sarcoptes scabiei]|nr:Calsequestrin-2 [Sarcoptes scabiei]
MMISILFDLDLFNSIIEFWKQTIIYSSIFDDYPKLLALTFISVIVSGIIGIYSFHLPLNRSYFFQLIYKIILIDSMKRIDFRFTFEIIFPFDSDRKKNDIHLLELWNFATNL